MTREGAKKALRVVGKRNLDKGAVFMVVYENGRKDAVYANGDEDFMYVTGMVASMDWLDARDHLLQLASLRGGIVSVQELSSRKVEL
jgi:hypothetical protein